MYDESERPNPDELLRQIGTEEAPDRMGKLKTPSRFVNAVNSTRSGRIALHLINETKRSIESEDKISFFNSESILGSFLDPVNKAFSTIDVSGCTALIVLMLLAEFIFSYNEVNTSPFSRMILSSNSGSFVCSAIS